METRKVYVEVDAHFGSDGRLFPTAITWEDGRHFEIDRVLDARRAASLKAGGVGTRYRIRILGKERYLWYEGPGWFVEAPALSAGG
ncbi:hypothetical protein [Anaeromassilibacillus senegalensis]|uniref:hypothetical protein n=1 Tax=Anaeromassilibacillus senegalensis TaxID=1673717 RepID=UPI000681EE16|nr:hypothetical protein [Anaeromassilibacillus senegalensis]